MGQGAQGRALSGLTFERKSGKVGAMGMVLGEECSRPGEQPVERCEEGILGLISLNFSFHICMMGIIIVPAGP